LPLKVPKFVPELVSVRLAGTEIFPAGDIVADNVWVVV
jgi:hypothetical protein